MLILTDRDSWIHIGNGWFSQGDFTSYNSRFNTIGQLVLNYHLGKIS